MAKRLNWDKADVYQPDPGAVVEVPELTRPSRWVGPKERARRAEERRKRDRERQEASERHDHELADARLERLVRNYEDRGLPLPPLLKFCAKRLQNRN